VLNIATIKSELRPMSHDCAGAVKSPPHEHNGLENQEIRRSRAGCGKAVLLPFEGEAYGTEEPRCAGEWWAH
jgi:hypothetical protein